MSKRSIVAAGGAPDHADVQDVEVVKQNLRKLLAQLDKARGIVHLARAVLSTRDRDEECMLTACALDGANAVLVEVWDGIDQAILDANRSR